MGSVRDNLVLVGMPGAGKSTVGVLLAKATWRGFVDTDVVIQAREGRRLQDILDSQGVEAFRQIEERHVLALAHRCCVVATGGSVVYSDRAMAHLKATGVAVHLHLPFDILERRLTNLDSRGVVILPGQSLRELFDKRQPLYERFADVTVECTGLGHDQVVAATMATLGL